VGSTREATPRSPAYADLVETFDRFAEEEDRWSRRTSAYHALVRTAMRFHVPPGARVLEIGCGSGDLLAALEPAFGVGVDASEKLVERARRRHPEQTFVAMLGEELDLDEEFDYVVLSDLLPYAHDILALLARVRAHSHHGTRVVINSYSRAWRPLLKAAELLHLKPRKPMRNWVAPHDVRNLLALAGFEVVFETKRILLPLRIPFVTAFVNGFLASLWPLNHLCLTYWIVARPAREQLPPQTVTIVCPCRNEEGNIEAIVRRAPVIGLATELVFVEGGSTDGTRAEIERLLDARQDLDVALVGQPGSGKADAVRAGFAAAANDVLMILDGDLSVQPEDLPKFYDALIQGHGELVNGSRLVYDVDPGAMPFLNTLGNRLFSRLFRWITGQEVKDTLCGTKALLRSDYARVAAGRSYFGEFDPFGDFDLLLGAARLGLRIVDLPVRYHPRTYGSTNISRWRHGALLAKMTAFAFWKLRVEPSR
jgi:SAM-dependent methyltransferase